MRIIAYFLDVITINTFEFQKFNFDSLKFIYSRKSKQTNHMKKTLIMLFLSLCFSKILAQSSVMLPNGSVGIGTSTPSQKLEVVGTIKATNLQLTQGFLPARMTSAQRDAIASPTQGLMIYCTNCGLNGEPEFYNGTTWVNMIGGTAAGLVIRKADYNTNYSAGGAVFTNFEALPASVTVPNAGETQTWNFSTLAETSSSIGGTNFLTPTNTAFPSASYSALGTFSFEAGSVISPIVAATFFTEINDGGTYELGYSQDAATAVTLPSLGATISYAAQNYTYTGTTKYPNVLFPAKVGNATSVINGIVGTSNYTVNAPALGLNNVPGQTRVTTSITMDVIGSGIANLKGIGNVRVLLVKNSHSDMSNYFLGGAPAPTPLLTNLGLVDGTVTTCSVYRFIAEGLGTVGIIEVNANGVVTKARFRRATI